MKDAASRTAFERAKRFLAGGVSSPVRAWGAVGGEPVTIARGRGARVWDLDGNAYLDLVASWGALVLGHAHPDVVRAASEAAAAGLTFGAPCGPETELAALVCERVPCAERARFTSSGTEAAMHAVRLARGSTGRDEILKLAGGYHGASDALLARAGSGAATFGLPGTAGVPDSLARLTHVLPYNDADALRALLAERGERIAAVFVEPAAGNMGVVPPEPGYLAAAREASRAAGALLVFDEVITGFRLARGGAQELYGVAPDLCLLGKILGGGLPAGAIAGRADVMERLAPAGEVYQAGTLSGNPVAMAAGLATLRALDAPRVYEKLESLGARLAAGLLEAAAGAGAGVTLNRAGSMMTVFFTPERVRDLASAKTSDTRAYARFFHAMREAGVMLPPSQFEALFVSLAHTETDIDAAVEAARGAFKAALKKD